MISSYYEYQNPIKLISGLKAVDQLTYELSMKGAARPVLIAGKKSSGKGIIKKIVNAFGGTDVIFSGIIDVDDAVSGDKITEEISGIYRKSGFDAIIAAGCGNVMDIAGRARVKIFSESGSGTGQPGALPYYAIPSGPSGAFCAASSAAAAAENVAVYRPDIIIIDPETIMLSVRAETAEGAIAAFASSVETAIDENRGPVREAFAHASVKAFGGNLIMAVRKNKNRKCVFTLANASVQAGFASSNISGGIIYSISKLISGQNNIAAGTLCGIILPHFLDVKLNTSADALAKLLLSAAGDDLFAKTPAQKRAGTAVSIIKDNISAVSGLCGFPKTLGEAGVKKDKLIEAPDILINDKNRSLNLDSAGKNILIDILDRAY
ncbi:MAG: iron-containing alcohol dehydrogenase [Spirochaetes bacterium]|jgi:alcohol dehydrogenase|nr:iron-containing alcohol dehydrogenase [Spirochaetota bacterium]